MSAWKEIGTSQTRRSSCAEAIEPPREPEKTQRGLTWLLDGHTQDQFRRKTLYSILLLLSFYFVLLFYALCPSSIAVKCKGGPSVCVGVPSRGEEGRCFPPAA